MRLPQRREVVEAGFSMPAHDVAVRLRQRLRVERKHGQAFGALCIHAGRFESVPGKLSRLIAPASPRGISRDVGR